MNGPTRKKFYEQLCQRDGEYCRCCGIMAHERQLVVDHKDNNNGNNSLSNLQLLCRTCNYLKNPRNQPIDMCERSRSETSLRVNRSREPAFRKYIYEQIIRHGSWPWKRLMISGAEKTRVSTITAKRYLDKMVSNEGTLEILSGNIKLKEREDLEKILSGAEADVINKIIVLVNQEREYEKISNQQLS